VTTRREGFYWLTVLFTFALGTAAGDLTAERLAVGYWKSALLFAALIGIVFALHRKLGFNAILAFWIAYILTRPLGASIGDYLSQPRSDGGLGLGTTVTSVIFLLTIPHRCRLPLSDQGGRDRGQDRDRVQCWSSRIRFRVAARVGRGEQGGGNARPDRGRTRPSQSRSCRVRPPRPEPGAPGVRPATVPDLAAGDALLEETLPQLEEAVGARMEGRVATSPNAYDDIVQELDGGVYSEIILETPPSHVSHWLHIDLAERIAHLGYPLTTVIATH